MSAASNPRPRRSVPVAYRNALILAAVVCATVIGIFLVDPLVAPGDAHATTLPAFYGAKDDRTPRIALGEAEVWAADDSAKGARPDAAH